MKVDIYRYIQEDLKIILPEDRYLHTLGVADTAFFLALIYKIDPYKARLAGLLHDCAKYISKSEFKDLFYSSGVVLNKADSKAPQIWHALYAPYIARDKYGIKDEEILSSIRWHTTGKINMSILDKIIYISDYIEPNRDKAKNLDYLRVLAFKDIDMTLYNILKDTVDYLEKKEAYVHPDTLAALEWIGEEINDR